MEVHFSSGAILYSTDMAGWGAEGVQAFARVLDAFSAARDIRICAVLDGTVQFVYIPVSKIDYLSLTQAEVQLLQQALAPKEASDEPTNVG